MVGQISKNWYLMPYREYDGAFNMALDYYMAENYESELERPLLRFYGWEPYCLSLGIHQKTHDINFRACEENGIDVVRRPTGGRGVLHAEELTYGVIVSLKEFSLPQLYEYMHVNFAEALNDFSIPAVLESNKPDLKKFYKQKHSNLCFASAAQTEVKVHNKKLIGSAQHLFRKSILQHGSILIGEYHRKIVDLMKLQDNEKERFKRIIRMSTYEIANGNEKVTPVNLSEKIIDIFETKGIKFSKLELTEKQLEAIEKLKERFLLTHEQIVS